MDPLYVFLFTKIASTEGFVVVICVTALVLFLVRRGRKALSLLLTSAGLIASVNFLKEWLEVPRPAGALVEVTGYAFPSGHAAGAAFLAVVAAHLVRKLQKPERYVTYLLGAAFIVVICHSRLVLGVHTLEQVAAGTLVGLVWGLVYDRTSKR